jgi:hypothetical protein
VNIEKYFNPKGLLRFDKFEQFKDIVYSLTPDQYDNLLPYALENQALAKPYWQSNIFARIEDQVEKHINLALAQNQNQFSQSQTA